MGKVRRKGKRKKRKEKGDLGAMHDTGERRKRPVVLLKISALLAVETRWSKRQSWSTRQGLQVGTEIGIFRRSSKKKKLGFLLH